MLTLFIALTVSAAMQSLHANDDRSKSIASAFSNTLSFAALYSDGLKRTVTHDDILVPFKKYKPRSTKPTTMAFIAALPQTNNEIMRTDEKILITHISELIDQHRTIIPVHGYKHRHTVHEQKYFETVIIDRTTPKA